VKAVVYQDVGKVAVGDVPEPRIEDPSDAIVRVTMSAICGSDLHLVEGRVPLLPGETIGHEAVGVIEETGSKVERFTQGTRVVVAFDNACGHCWFCRRGQTALCEEFRNLGGGTFGGSLGGAQAERVRIPYADTNLLRVPDEVDDERALFVGDTLTTGLYGTGIADIGAGDTVAVVGAGPVGFFSAQAARVHGARQVVVLDREPDRLTLAERVGAIPIDVTKRNAQMAVHSVTEGRGADVVIEAVGEVAAFDSALEVVRRGGTVCVLGLYSSQTIEMQLGFIWVRAIRMLFAGLTPVHAWWERAMEAVRSGRIDPLPLVSHRLPLSEAARGYELFASRQATKVLLKP
jgi:2-desacetyl-2-hydroxyethyl bacteriochlorophyllide A dehydrogenase